MWTRPGLTARSLTSYPTEIKNAFKLYHQDRSVSHNKTKHCRKKPRLDVEGNRPATQLSSAEIRALHQDRAPLLRRRGLLAAPSSHDVRNFFFVDVTRGPSLRPPF